MPVYSKVMKCRRGHVYRIGAGRGTFAALHLGNGHFERCPVGKHWGISRSVDPMELDDEQHTSAA